MTPTVHGTFHGVYKITLEHEALGVLWACAEFTDVDLRIRVQHMRDPDNFRVTGTYVDFYTAASSLADTGEALGRLRYVSLAQVFMEALEDEIDLRAETAPWN